MKIDKYVKDVFDRLEPYSSDFASASASSDSNNDDERVVIVDDDGTTYREPHDDEYYLDRNSIPPRFAYYRHARWEKLDDWGRLTNQGVDDTITQDELDYYLKAKLREPPEERYQKEKANSFFHDLSCYMTKQNPNEEGAYGCTNLGCVPECRFYPEYGRIEDEEVITDHNESVEYYRKNNAIVEPPSAKELLELASEYRFS